MAFHVDMSPKRDGCGSLFPRGTATKLVNYWGSGPLRLFPPDDVPSELPVDTDRKLIPDFVFAGGKILFSPEARAVAEELEPGIHQFFPVWIRRERGKIPFYRADGTVLEMPYYLLNPGVRLDAVDLEKSDVKICVTPIKTLVTVKPGSWNRVVLRRSVVEGHHIWKGENQLGLFTFFSNHLAEIYRDYKWRGLQLTPVTEL